MQAANHDWRDDALKKHVPVVSNTQIKLNNRLGGSKRLSWIEDIRHKECYENIYTTKQ